MAMSGGTDKDMRMQSSWSPDDLDHSDHRFPVTGEPVMPISVGSKLIKTSPSRYRECLKNHAASIGGHVTDGCGEFMPSGDDGTLDALKCAACNCHRNFHRKDSSCGESSDFLRSTAVRPLPLPAPPLPSPPSINKHRTPMPLNVHSNYWSTASMAPPKMGYCGGGSAGADSSSEELNFSPAAVGAPPPAYGTAKKRFRTKFTEEQKEKMMEFAEKVGWRIPREDDVDVQRFCGEIGVKRQVFKVWMHNNKTAAASASASAAASASAMKNVKQGQESYGD